MNIAAIPLRQWLIAVSGLTCGALAALLLHWSPPERGCQPRIRPI